MAEALVSIVLEQLTSITTSEAEQEVRLVVAVKKEVKKLYRNLEAIQAVLAHADERELKDANVKLWLDKLKDLTYEMDDVLDEWQTAILKSEIEGSEHISQLKQKVSSFIRSFCFCFGEVGLGHDIASKIVELNEKLDDIAEQKSRYNFESKRGPQQVERLVTTSIINMPEVKGREQEKNAIMKVLLNDGSDRANPQIISLIGVGGIGKTTLAKLLYNDGSVETHFSKKIWVCVSDPFDENRIAKAILESLLGFSPNTVELQKITQQIKQLIEGKKFLLVLDDVWNEVRGKWELLKGCLQCGSPGSKILVTTRNENVARIMDCHDSDMFQIGELSDDQCWSLFSQIAISERSSIDHNNLEDIGRKIVNKCKGLPLAVKILGGLLRFKRSRIEWENVLDSEIWELEEAKKNLFAPLLLSYYDLPSALRQYFLYCVVFLKGYEMRKDKLIRLWMAQNYLRSIENKDMELIGEEYFEILSTRYFFQDFRMEINFDSITFKIHNIVHDFAQFITKFDCVNIELNDYDNILQQPLETTRHLGLKMKSNSYPRLYTFKKLRSLFVLDMFDVSSLPNLFNQLTCLRSLDLTDCVGEKIPPTINKLIHLRQLDLSMNRYLKKLSKSICELYNLQSLDVRFCESLEKLPHNIGKLRNLRHLRTLRFAEPLVLPKIVGSLSCLRTLDPIDLGHDRNEEAFSLGDLKNLNHLGGFLGVMGLGKVKDDVIFETRQIKLIKQKRNITRLAVGFAEMNGEWRKLGDEETLESLEPSQNLQVLGITGYLGSSTIFTNWVSFLTNLREFYLAKCANMEHLPPLGLLPSLEALTLEEMNGVKKVGIEFLGIMGSGVQTSSSSSLVAFPKLTKLHFEKMKEWEDFGLESNRYRDEDTSSAASNIIVMPSLQYLYLHGCNKLKAIPHYILQKTTLKELKITGSSLLKQRYQKNDWPIISHIPEIDIG